MVYKNSMDILRGASCSGTGRVAYERIQQSEIYQTYLKLSNNLKAMDLGIAGPPGREEVLWINLYNVIVIHGVIALGEGGFG